jgi:plasmid stability protein
MAQKSRQKGAPVQKMKTLLLPLQEDLHMALKIRAAEQKSTIKDFVTRLLERELKGGEKKK